MAETTVEIRTKKQLLEKLKVLGPISVEQRKEIVCSLIGHSHIVDRCFGYITCGRCGVQVGDQLIAGWSGAKKGVVVGHKCPTCKANYAKMNWRDKYLAPDPFK